ncbi:MAG: EAL domain-containing protein [Nostoc sp. ChiQUE02]|uniref:EAL domain-containing protein n=1 Tax=Nostoc sp. ChiQUE02 TaxID=3075377 RepID=UPI002AD26076|nr:EAL domain-containing protein [Nostoc sp. ChiQUE02]MDZ8234640.1 EAL domain-containing protein [Nostoc sp. ChiQUE02]
MSQICPISKTCACRNVARCWTKEAGRLFLWFPVSHTLKKVTSYLEQSALKYELMHERPGLSLDCRPGQSQEIARNLAQLLAPRELKETQVLFIRGTIQPQLQDFSDIVSLQRFIKFNQSDWLVEMLATERFTSYFQPIVSINDTSQIFGYESLLRGLDEEGNLVLPGTILELATEAGLIPQIDQVARLSTITQFSRYQVSGHIFINFAPTSLYDPAFCLHSTVEAIDAAGISHERVVFEVVESDKPQDLDHLKAVLQYYRDAGFLVALDDLGSGYSSLNLLHQLRPDFIKLDMELIRDVHKNLYKALITEKLLEITQKLNIQTVAEGIECIEELNWLRERGATLAQGYLIAKPSAVPVTTTPHFDPIALIASANCQLVEQQVQHQSESERIVAAVTQRIRQSLELDEILQITVDEVRQLFDVDRVVIYQFKPDWSGLVAVESLAQGCMSILGFHVMDTCFKSTRATYYQQGNTRAIEDVENAGLSLCHIELLQSLQIRANLVVPILQQERLWGLLIAHQCRHPRQWQQSEINLFNQLAGQAAIAIQQSELYRQLQQANQELQRLACSDGLTQVANRRCFDDTLNAEWQRLAREQGSLSLILCDVDYFKLYNDTHGHLAGDDALRQVAKAISQSVKHPTDLVARYGGEEFAVILPNTDVEGAIAVARDIQTNVSGLKMLYPHSQVGEFITLSLGVATITPRSQLSPATLIAAADQGLYQAKAQGRNCVMQMDCESPKGDGK